VWRWDQGEPFGNDVPNNNPSGLGAFEFPLRFPGQYFDRETNLAYNMARDYDPGIGRYVESDPLGLILHTPEAGLDHLYAYVSSNPLSYVDFAGVLSACPPNGFVRKTLRFLRISLCNRHKPLLKPCRFLSISQFHLAFRLISTLGASKFRTACSLSGMMFF
jgi:RHS repeat-associated protein